jgi:hypothetical protein
MEDNFILLAVIVCVAFAFGTVYGWGLRERHAKRVADSLLKELESDIDNRMTEHKKSLIPIKIERHSGVFYVFNNDTDDFMGQGATKEELEEVLASRFPGKRFMAMPENLKEMGF